MKVLPSKEQILPMFIVALATVFVINRVGAIARIVGPKA